jgi:hypothetical protein
VTVTCVTITWSDGTITKVDPPNSATMRQAREPKLVGTSQDGSSRP